MLRHAVNEASASLMGINFPYGTAFINVTGSLVMGIIAGWFALRGSAGGQLPRLFLTTGILGGYTTFSTFSLDAALLFERGQTMGAVLYTAGSVGLGIVGVFAGLAFSRFFLA
jgi:CrcB protein